MSERSTGPADSAETPPAPEIDALAGARVAWLIELLHAQNVVHLDGCTGQAGCGACVIEDINSALTEPSRPIGGRRFRPDRRPTVAAQRAADVETRYREFWDGIDMCRSDSEERLSVLIAAEQAQALRAAAADVAWMDGNPVLLDAVARRLHDQADRLLVPSAETREETEAVPAPTDGGQKCWCGSPVGYRADKGFRDCLADRMHDARAKDLNELQRRAHRR